MAEGMELHTFIAATIMSVVRGVKQAQEENRAVGGNAVINPILSHANHSDARNIDFDIAVAVTGSKKGEDQSLELSVPLLNASLSGQGQTKAEMSNTSRVTFSVPVAFPGTRADQYPKQDRHQSSSYDYDDN